MQDTREQVPLVFDHPYVDDIELTTLNVGDYGVRFKDGYTPSVYFERKTKGDLFGTLGKGYRRFKREIVRAQKSNSLLKVIVEEPLVKVAKGTEYSSMNGESVVKRLMTLRWKHGVEFIFCKDSEDMALYITHTFIAMGKERMRRKKEGK